MCNKPSFPRNPKENCESCMIWNPKSSCYTNHSLNETQSILVNQFCNEAQCIIAYETQDGNVNKCFNEIQAWSVTNSLLKPKEDYVNQHIYETHKTIVKHGGFWNPRYELKCWTFSCALNEVQLPVFVLIDGATDSKYVANNNIMNHDKELYKYEWQKSNIF